MPQTQIPAEGNEVEIIVLTFWEKVAIAAGAAGFLLLVALCMVCILCPRCFLYGICSDEEDEGQKLKRSKKGSQRSVSSGHSVSSYGSTKSDYHYSSVEGMDVGPTSLWKPLGIIKEYDTGTSDWSSDTGSNKDVIMLEKKKKSHATQPVLNGDASDIMSSHLESGVLEFTLKYSLSDGKLVINILEIRDLKLQGSFELVSPYVKVRLYRSPKQFFTFGGNPEKDYVINNLDKEMKTKMQRPSEVLVYREKLEVTVDSDALRNYTIRLLLCDMDKLSRHVILGEASVSLRKAELPNFVELTFKELLMPPLEEDLGVINLGLSYLPTSEKLYLSVEDVKGLKVVDKRTKSTDPCVKAYLMYEGKQLKRVKTTVKAAQLNPVYEESFSFDVPQTELGRVYFTLAVCHYDKERKETKLIGRAYMGLNFDLSARDHWTSMMQNPRKKVVCMYKIQS